MDQEGKKTVEAANSGRAPGMTRSSASEEGYMSTPVRAVILWATLGAVCVPGPLFAESYSVEVVQRLPAGSEPAGPRINDAGEVVWHQSNDWSVWSNLRGRLTGPSQMACCP